MKKERKENYIIFICLLLLISLSTMLIKDKQNEKNDAIEVANKLKELVLTIKVKAGENGKIFGGVTSKEISENLKEQYKIEIDKKKIEVKETIKNIGRFTINIKLYEGVNAKLTVNIIAE